MMYPIGIIVFARKKDANDMINAWASDIDDLLSLVEKTTHMINKENMIYKVRHLSVQCPSFVAYVLY
jgi:26S proteasome regulatory subunit N5